MHLVDILTRTDYAHRCADALSLRANPMDRATKPAAQPENQDKNAPIINLNAQAPGPTRSGAFAFAPKFREVTH